MALTLAEFQASHQFRGVADARVVLPACPVLPPREVTSDIAEVHEHGVLRLTMAVPAVRAHLILISRLSEKTMDHNRAKVSLGLLTRRRDRLLEELRVVAPELVKKLEMTLEELKRHEHNGLEQ